MGADTKHAGAPSVASDSVQALRELVLLHTLNTLAFAVPVVALVIVVQAWLRAELDLQTVVLTSYGLVFPALRLLRRALGFRLAASILLVLIIFTVLIVAARGGVAVGNMSLALLALILGTLFFGRIGALLVFCGVVLALAIGAVLVLNGIVPPVNLTMWNPETAGFWVRQFIALVVLGIALVVTQVFIIERLIGLYNETQRLAQLELALEESRRIEGLARLAGGIAHDFNNTLTIIMGTTEMASYNIEDRKYLEQALKKIMDAAESSAELTRQLLMLGRHQMAAPKIVTMAPELARLCDALRRILPENLELRVDASSDAQALVDPMMLERAFYNLMLNARDAMPAGGQILVECRPWTGTVPGGVRDASKPHVLLKVSDNGVVLDEKTLSCIFDPFFTTKGQQGSGLGLATVHAWVKAAGGDIVAESTLGKGSAFTLSLPAN